MRVAVVDLGTNSTRLLVADVDDGRAQEVARRTAITRLGEGVDERRKLLPLPIARVRNVLADYRRELEQLGAERTLAIGTSAIRDAENGEAFLGEIEWSYGFATRLLSGEEEGELTRRGVAGGRELEPGTLVLDVGGGSTELIADGFRDESRSRLCSSDRTFPPLRSAHARGARGRRPRRPRGAPTPRADAGDRRRGHRHDPRRTRAREVRPRANPRPPHLARGGRGPAPAPRLPPTRAASRAAGPRARARARDRRRRGHRPRGARALQARWTRSQRA